MIYILRLFGLIILISMISGCVTPRDRVSDKIITMRQLGLEARADESKNVIVEITDTSGATIPLKMVKDSNGNFIIESKNVRTRYELISD